MKSAKSSQDKPSPHLTNKLSHGREIAARGELETMKTIGYIVLKGGQPCGLVNVAGGAKGGVLMPATMEEHVTMFLKPRDARRVVTRTGKVAATLRDSLIRDWPRAQPLFEDQPFTVLPVSKQ